MPGGISQPDSLFSPMPPISLHKFGNRESNFFSRISRSLGVDPGSVIPD
jgi:hypothetical protein